MKNLLGFVTLMILLLVYLYSIVFKVFPISTKILLEIVGFVYCFFQLLRKDKKLKKKYVWMIGYTLVLTIWDFIVCALNGEGQFHIIKSFMFMPILGMFAAHFLYVKFNKYFQGENDALKLIAITVFFESIISVIMKQVPSFGGWIDAIQIQPIPDSQKITDLENYYRFAGLGNAVFYSVLLPTTMGLLCSIYLVAKDSKLANRIFFFVGFVIISLVSFLTARTTIALVAISLFLYILFILTGRARKKEILIYVFLVFFLFSFALSLIDDNVMDWAFGFIIDKEDKTDTSYLLEKWYKNTSFDFKTLLIGDGIYSTPSGYYMKVDVGFFREIFYGGIVFLFLHLYYDYRLLKYTYSCNPTIETKWLMIAFFLCHIIILAKGDGSMLSFFVLLLVLYDKGIFKEKRLSKEILIN